MRNWILGSLLFASGIVGAQERLLVEANSTKVVAFAAYAQDSLHLQMQRQKGGKLSKLSLRSLDGLELLAFTSVKKVDHKIVLPKTAVYQLVFHNEKKKGFHMQLGKSLSNTSGKQARLIYKVKRDTVYGYKTMQYRKIPKVGTQEILHEKYYLHSRSNAILKGGKNRVIIPLQLPEKTQEWYISFTASRSEKDIEKTMASFNLAAELSGLAKKNNSLQQAVKQVYTPPGANICDLYLFDAKNAKLFKSGEDYTYIAEGTRENIKSGTIAIKQNTKRKYFLGIHNPDNLYGLHIAISAVGLTQRTEEILETINIPIITSYVVPVVK